MTPCQWCYIWTRVKANVWTWTVLAAKRYRWKKVYHFFPLVRVPLLYSLFQRFSAVWTCELQVCPKAPSSPHFSSLLQRAAVPILQNLILLRGSWLIGFRRSQACCGVSCKTSHLFVCRLSFTDRHQTPTPLRPRCHIPSAASHGTQTPANDPHTCKANKMQMRAMQLIRLVGTDPQGRDGSLCAFKHFLLNQKRVVAFNFLFNMNEAVSSIYMRAINSYHARY